MAGFNEVEALTQATGMIEHHEGGELSMSRKSPGTTKVEVITLERGETCDPEFLNWASKVWSFRQRPVSIPMPMPWQSRISSLTTKAGSAASTSLVVDCVSFVPSARVAPPLSVGCQRASSSGLS